MLTFTAQSQDVSETDSGSATVAALLQFVFGLVFLGLAY